MLQYPMVELKEDADHLFQLIEEDSKYEGLLQILTHEAAMQAVTEAFNLLYSAPRPLEDKVNMDLTTEGCLVVSLLNQFLVRYLIKKLMQLMTTEAIILYRNSIPKSYLNHYFKCQAHFSLRDLISIYHKQYRSTML